MFYEIKVCLINFTLKSLKIKVFFMWKKMGGSD